LDEYPQILTGCTEGDDFISATASVCSSAGTEH
jgi:hypothetical protein